jgi:hypothetical protein
MNRSRTFQLAAAAVVCAALGPSSALAGGEPKNLAPFTRAAATPAHAHLAAVLRRAARPSAGAATGESKNGPPFTGAAR